MEAHGLVWSWVLLLLCPASVVTGQLGLAAANESGGDVIGDAGKHGGELVIEMVKGRGDEVMAKGRWLRVLQVLEVAYEKRKEAVEG
ncbi:hypothetical protein M0R45_026889 [Rubus argutus]|uniref:Uncharacterized protein n=1 Tax=Rubus argutus TaxID=59490 RepID=A0AAW1X0K1_RUBAR